MTPPLSGSGGEVRALHRTTPEIGEKLLMGLRQVGAAAASCLPAIGIGDTLDRMTAPSDHPVTEILLQIRAGDREALDRLMVLVYDELAALAHRKLSFEQTGHTLQTTALVHEAYLKLVDQRRVNWQNRSHFFAVAATAMRRILVNHAEARRAAKRGGAVSGRAPVALPLEAAGVVAGTVPDDELLALHEALNRLEQFNERGARVVEYKFFGGLGWDEIAATLGVSPITVRRAWESARAWLKRELR
jgi:RNA polymerase sigma factor (TIGR02999 family)